MNTLPIGEQTREFYRRQGELRELERIIKLLEGLIDTRPTEVNGGWRGYSLERVIALIKGEK